jgi:hypothetical protein
MSDAVLTAAIAAVVSLLVSLVATWSEGKRHKREMTRRSTEKVLDLRLKAYPLVFKITDQVTGRILFSKDKPITPEALHATLEELEEWHRAMAGFLLTPKSIRAYRALREALATRPADSGCYTHRQLETIWTSKNEFRGALKADLYLLYKEDRKGISPRSFWRRFFRGKNAPPSPHGHEHSAAAA